MPSPIVPTTRFRMSRRLALAAVLIILPSSLVFATDNRTALQEGLQVQMQKVRNKSSVAQSFSDRAKSGLPVGITVATGGDMAVGVAALDMKNAKPTRVVLLDASLLMAKNGGKLPTTLQRTATLIKEHPQSIMVDTAVTPPQMVSVSGVPDDNKVTIVAGAEGIMGNPPKRPPGSQAFVLNKSQLIPRLRPYVPSTSVRARTKAP